MVTSLIAVNQQIECIDTNHAVDHALNLAYFFTEADPVGLIKEKQKDFLRNFITGIIATKNTTIEVTLRRNKFNKEVVVIQDAFK